MILCINIVQIIMMVINLFLILYNRCVTLADCARFVSSDNLKFTVYDLDSLIDKTTRDIPITTTYNNISTTVAHGQDGKDGLDVVGNYKLLQEGGGMNLSSSYISGVDDGGSSGVDGGGRVDSGSSSEVDDGGSGGVDDGIVGSGGCVDDRRNGDGNGSGSGRGGVEDGRGSGDMDDGKNIICPVIGNNSLMEERSEECCERDFGSKTKLERTEKSSNSGVSEGVTKGNSIGEDGITLKFESRFECGNLRKAIQVIYIVRIELLILEQLYIYWYHNH